MRERLAHETFGYTPVMIEHLMDEGLLMALRDGRREMNYQDLMEAKFTEEIGTKQSTVYTDSDRESVATHEAGHATVAYFLGKDRRLEVLSIIKRRGSLGLLAHSDQEERFTRTKSDLEAGIAIALGGLVAEEMCIGESGTGPANDLAHATTLAANMVGSFGMAGSLISFDALSNGPLGGANLVAKVLGDADGQTAGRRHPRGAEGTRARGPRGEPRRPRGAARRAHPARRARPRRDPRRDPARAVSTQGYARLGLDARAPRTPRLTQQVLDGRANARLRVPH